MAHAPLFHRDDIASAIAILTRLPVRVATPRGAAAAWTYPLVGGLVGGLAGICAWLALAVGLGPFVAAALAVAALFLLTGGLHDDGLADTADGLWGGWTRERRMEIMRDSRVGVYGVGAVGLAMLLRWTSLVEVAGGGGLLPALVVAGAVSRTAMVAVWHRVPSARADGLAAGAGRPGMATAGVALGLALVIAAITVGLAVWPMILAVALAAFYVAAIAKRRIGGQTGDILGAVQVATEIAALIILAALAP